MTETYRSLDRRLEKRLNADGSITETGPDFPQFTVDPVESYRESLWRIEIYPMQRALAVKAGWVNPDSDDEPDDEDYHAFLQSVGLKEREQIAAREWQTEEFTRRNKLPPERLELE